MRSKSNLTRTISTKSIAGPTEVRLDSLIQGVSQQPKHLRTAGQGEEQINGWSSPVEGLTKRNPMRLVGRILPLPITDFYLGMMTVAAGERYSVMTYPNGSKTNLLITLNGSPVAVDVHGAGLTTEAISTMDPLVRGLGQGIQGDATSYLGNAAGDFYKKYVLINNGPLGLLLNREKTVAMDTAATAAAKNEALIFVQGVAYEIEYKLTLDGTALPAVTTPKASDTNNALSTSSVAQKLADEINKIAGFTTTVDRYVVHVRRTDGGPFTLKLDDARGNSLARVVKGSVTSLSELPTVAPNGLVIQVSSDPSQTLDDRWLKFTTYDGSAMGSGSWAETAKPGVQYRIDPSTMPLVIYRAARGVLFVGPADGATRTLSGVTYTFPKWGERTAGDEKTVPNPAFVGKKIRDHILFRGRYALAAGQSVVFSETDDAFNFFQDTSVSLTAKDGFSVLALSEISSELNWLLAVDESILAFSQYSQFRVSAADADVLTPLTAMILRLSNLEMNPNIRPKLAGPQILFGTDEYGYSHFREYSFYDSPQRRSGLNLGASNDVCSSVPKYVQGLVTHWDVGETIDVAISVSPVDRKTVYVYKYLFQQGQQEINKAQSSWSKFRFGGEVQWVGFLDNQLWLVLTYPDGTYSAFIAFDELETLGSEQIYLDRLIQYPECNGDPQTSNDVVATYDPDTRRTTFKLPYAVSGKARAVVRYTNGTQEGLMLGEVDSGSTIECDLHGDWTRHKIAFGEDYQFRYEFSTPHVQSADSARSRIVGRVDGRTQLLTFATDHHNTGRYDIRVQRMNRELDSVHKFRSRHLNVTNNRMDTETSHLETGSFRVPIYSRNINCRIFVESSSWLPVTLTGAQWEGAYSNRAKG